MVCIYCIRNKFNDKRYIGSTKNLEARVRAHFEALENHNHVNIKLQNDYDIFGKKAFEIEIVLEVPKDTAKEELFRLEDEFIVKFDSKANGYNIANAKFGDAYTYHPNKEEIHSKIVNGLKNRYKNYSEEDWKKFKENHSGSNNGMFGKKHSDLVKLNQSLKMREYYSNGNHPGNYGKSLPEHQRKILSEYAKQRTGEKNPFYGKTHSDEFKAKMSKRMKGVTPPNAIKCEIDGVLYQSLGQAHKALNIPYGVLIYRCKSKTKRFANYKLINA